MKNKSNNFKLRTFIWRSEISSLFFRMNNSIPDEFELARRIEETYPPVLLAVGIPGNILSLIILVRIRKSTNSPYLVFLAGVDLFILCISLLPHWIGGMQETDIRDIADVVCKLHVFAVYASLQMSSWILVLVTCERVCSVIFPHKVRVVCTRGRSLISLSFTVMCILCLNSHFLVGYHLEFRPGINRTRCICKEDFEDFEFKIWPWIDFIVVFLIPCILLLLGNITIVHKLRTNQKFNKDSIRQNSAVIARRNTISFLTKMAVSLNTVFIICVGPVSIFSIGQPYWWPPETLTEEGYAKLTLSWTVATLLMYLNNCVNFLLYMMFGSKFRNELKRLFISKCCKTKKISSNTYDIYRSTSRPSLCRTLVISSLYESSARPETVFCN